MGCYESGSTKSLSKEEQIIIEVERSFGFSKIKSKELIKLFIDNSDSSNITKDNLESILEGCKINQKLMKYIFKRFAHRDICQIKKINCLAILLGNSTIRSKIKRIFRNYFSDEPGKLTKSDIEMMISHIIFISLSFIPDYALYLYPNDSILIEYCSKFQVLVNPLLKYFISKLLGTSNDISFLDLSEAFNIEPFNNLLNTSKLRQFSYSLINSILKNNNDTTIFHLKSKSETLKTLKPKIKRYNSLALT